MTAARFVDVGDRVPEILLLDLDGGEIALTSFTGKKLIVFMWASW